jgi:hypothetical protein
VRAEEGDMLGIVETGGTQRKNKSPNSIVVSSGDCSLRKRCPNPSIQPWKHNKAVFIFKLRKKP